MVRLKTRYIVAKAPQMTSTEMYKFILDQIYKYFGEFGVAAVKPALHIHVVFGNIQVVKARRGQHKLVLDALSKSTKVTTLYTGATIKHCLLFIKQYLLKDISHAQRAILEQKLDHVAATVN